MGFMSLLKALQIFLLVPKFHDTKLDSKSARLINQIIVDEESDLNYNGEPKVTLKYLKLWKKSANTLPINNFITRIKEIETQLILLIIIILIHPHNHF